MAWSYLGLFSKFYTQNEKFKLRTQVINAKYRHGNSMLHICSLLYVLGTFTVENETRCYEELGCLNVTREWYHLIYRPFNVFPLPRQVIDTRFVLYTRKNPTEVSNVLCHRTLCIEFTLSELHYVHISTQFIQSTLSHV